MKKTYVTSMPNHIGAFLKASKCFSSLGINITRVSYNKAVDSHTLFIDVDGDDLSIKKADEILNEIGYLTTDVRQDEIVLLEFTLVDVPGSVTRVLEVISEFNFNISYISSQENGSGYQYFKMGLYVTDKDRLNTFLSKVRDMCEVKVLDYNHSEKVYDNSIFYSSYVNALSKEVGLTKEKESELLVNVNLAMQTLDERDLSPYKTFDSIQRFAQMIANSKGDSFTPRVTVHQITYRTKVTLIEPDCGSNTAIIESGGERLFVDTGYACYKKEMLSLIKAILPDFGKKHERVFVTHADVDHCGLVNEFDEIIVSKESYDSLKNESEGRDGVREVNPLHKPYASICKILTEYTPVSRDKLTAISSNDNYPSILTQIGVLKVGELCFEIYEGSGGHVKGETILIDYEHKVAFTGDVYVNMSDMTKKQLEYNRYAPILMTSVDTDPVLAKKVRDAVLNRLGEGEWKIFGGHGNVKNYTTKTIK